MLRYDLYLKDILRAIDEIEKSLKNRGRTYFEKDFNIADATAMRLQVIGESIHKLPEFLKKKNDEINWKRFVEFGNDVSHAYFRVNKDILWDVAKNELTELKKIVRRIRNEK